MDLGLTLSFAGNLTFSNAGPLRAVAKEVPLERVVMETDAPFLAPQGRRGKRNEPAYLNELMETWAKLKDLTPEDVARITSVNAYHLFASMTLVRRDIVIEGSDDGTTWKPYELRYKPGDPDRAPPFVAPHQPRLDFQLWFLLLGGRRDAPYFDMLLRRLREEPATVAPLFARDPFPTEPPRHLRVAVYRYQFTDVTTRRATGAWWRRELLGYLPGGG